MHRGTPRAAPKSRLRNGPGLAQVDLVDLQSVRFLRDCQDQKIELRNCSPYVLEWIRRERAEDDRGSSSGCCEFSFS